ncbi:MAG: histidine ammonia-lyase [Saprospiraceae bacterium]|nr:histidine ammonia-lyase [Saprospiraceae bacterium]
MSTTHFINREVLTLEQLDFILKNKLQLALSTQSRKDTEGCYQFLHQKLKNSNQTFYGINTGFGSLCNVRISNDQIEQLQQNLVRSHACGVGDEVPHNIVKIMLLLKIQSLSYGHSGVRVETIERLIQLYNDDALPTVYQLGSLGASGDLAPLAHLSLPLIGEGTVFYKNEKIPTPQYLTEKGLDPLTLQAKEGLALLNGTQFSAAYCVWILSETQRLAAQANLNAALSIDAFDCKLEPFDERLTQVRPHLGAHKVATTIRNILRGSEVAAQIKTAVQDPYAFRCIPQVHGASMDAIRHIAQVCETEINSITDNPTIFPESDAILSGGNFHAQPLALALDYLAIALSELGSISERRTFQLLSGQRGLPVYLTENGGIESGMMIAQYTAASIASQNKQLATPASVDSIVSSNGQEDHVSMAANAATKCYRIVENLERLLAIEFMVAAQALSFRRPLKSSVQIETILLDYRKIVPVLRGDKILSEDIFKTIGYLKELTFNNKL